MDGRYSKWLWHQSSVLSLTIWPRDYTIAAIKGKEKDRQGNADELAHARERDGQADQHDQQAQEALLGPNVCNVGPTT